MLSLDIPIDDNKLYIDPLSVGEPIFSHSEFNFFTVIFCPSSLAVDLTAPPTALAPFLIAPPTLPKAPLIPLPALAPSVLGLFNGNSPCASAVAVAAGASAKYCSYKCSYASA